MKILIIDNGTHHLLKIKELLLGSEVTICPYFSISANDCKTYDILILSGGAIHPVVGNEKLFKNELDFIRTIDKPIIGICLGFQLIAYAFGANLQKLNKKEKGIVTINWLDQRSNIFKDFANKSIKVYESHKWVAQSLSNSLIGLAKSNNGYEVIKHRTKPIYGFQFHPELFVDQTYGRAIFERVFKKIKSEIIK